MTGSLDLNNLVLYGLWGLTHLRAALLYPDKIVEYGLLAGIIFLSACQRIHITKSIYLCVVYFLCFYTLVFEYHFTALMPCIAICLVTLPAFQTHLARISTLLTCLPSCYAVFRLLDFQIIHYSFDFSLDPGAFDWQLIAISKFVPVLLCGVVLAADIKPIYVQLRGFFVAMRKVNEYYQVFGDNEDVTRSEKWTNSALLDCEQCLMKSISRRQNGRKSEIKQ